MRPTSIESSKQPGTLALKRAQTSSTQQNKRIKPEHAQENITQAPIPALALPSSEGSKMETTCTKVPLLIINSRRKAAPGNTLPVYLRSGTEADGNCFFHAVVHQLNHYKINADKYDYKTLRAAVVDYIRENSEHFQEFIFAIGYEMDTYLSVMAKNKEYADEIMLQATVETLEVNIKVIFGQGKNQDGRATTCDIMDHPPKTKKYASTLYLVYECCNPLNPNSWHYDSVIPAPEPAKALGYQISSIQ